MASALERWATAVWHDTEAVAGHHDSDAMEEREMALAALTGPRVTRPVRSLESLAAAWAWTQVGLAEANRRYNVVTAELVAGSRTARETEEQWRFLQEALRRSDEARAELDRYIEGLSRPEWSEVAESEGV